MLTLDLETAGDPLSVSSCGRLTTPVPGSVLQKKNDGVHFVSANVKQAEEARSVSYRIDSTSPVAARRMCSAHLMGGKSEHKWSFAASVQLLATSKIYIKSPGGINTRTCSAHLCLWRKNKKKRTFFTSNRRSVKQSAGDCVPRMASMAIGLSVK